MFSVSREAIYLFGFSIRWYGVMIALGAFCAIALSDRREKKYGLEKDTVISLALIALPAAIICARVYYVLFRLDVYLASPLSIFNIREGGLAIYGGLIGGTATGYIFAKKRKLSFFTLADLAAPSLALGQAIGRWGNFFNMEAYGSMITNPKLCFFPLAVYIPSENAYFAAAFFYESVWCFLIVITYLIIEKHNRFRFTGAGIAYYTAMYAFERAIVEGLRQDSLYLGPVRISQLLSVILIFSAALFAVLKASGAKKRRMVVYAALTAFTICLLSVSGVIGSSFCAAGCVLLLLIALRYTVSSRKSLCRSRNS